MAISEPHASGGLERWLRRSFSDHIYVHLIPEISDSRMRRLGFSGLRLLGLYILCALCAPPLVNLTVAALRGRIAEYEIPFFEMGFYAVVVLCFARQIIRTPAEQALLYRRQHGKWRWDH